VVSIPACHAGDPGSIPGNGDFFILSVASESPWETENGAKSGEEIEYQIWHCTAPFAAETDLAILSKSGEEIEYQTWHCTAPFAAETDLAILFFPLTRGNWVLSCCRIFVALFFIFELKNDKLKK
jgi:hypothetical protein